MSLNDKWAAFRNRTAKAPKGERAASQQIRAAEQARRKQIARIKRSSRWASPRPPTRITREQVTREQAEREWIARLPEGLIADLEAAGHRPEITTVRHNPAPVVGP